MTIDERLEALAMHLEVLTHMHEELEKKTGERLETLIHVHEELPKVNGQLRCRRQRLH